MMEIKNRKRKKNPRKKRNSTTKEAGFKGQDK